MADSFGTTPAEQGDALLKETTNATKPVIPGAQVNQEQAKLARDKGWVAQVPFKYEHLIPAIVRSAEGASELNLQDGEEAPGWAHRAVKYEHNDEFGDVAPRLPALEKILFGSELRLKKGNQFEKLLSIKVVQEGVDPIMPIRKFKDAGLHPTMLDNVEMSGYDVPTPVQAYAIPAVLQGKDVVGISQTGSGKTAAYMIPTFSKLMGKAKKLCAARPNYTRPDYDHRRDRVRAEPLVLIVAPTRELCIQIFDESRRLCYRSMLRPCVAYGGGPIQEQRADLEKGCDVLIASPGRLRDFMSDSSLLSLHRLRFTIIDEADEMLQDDWAEELEQILHGGDANIDAQHQYLLFSATFHKDLRTVAKKYLAQDYVRIRIGRTGSTVPNIKQQVVWVDKNQKKQALYDLLIASPPARTLIFVKSKKAVDFVDDFLFNLGMPTTSMHSSRTQLEREDATRSFRNGESPIMIATGVGARGLDIRNVMHVVNYDLPEVEYGGQDEYIHRIGRTGRAGNEGLATSFYNSDDEPLAPFLAKILVENGHEVPDFLEDYKPAEGEELDFDDDSGDEQNEPVDGATDTNTTTEGAWGAGPVVASAPTAEDSWGTGPTSTNGFAEREDAGTAWGTSNSGAAASGGW